MIRKFFLATGIALLLSAVPALAAGHGGGGHGGGGHGGGGAHYGGGGYYSGGGYHGGYSGGIILGFGGGGYYGNGYSGGGYYGNGNLGGGYYGNGYPGGSYYAPIPNVAPSIPYPAIIPPTAPQNPTTPLGAVTGLKITDLYDGTAKAAGLRKGDIILKVDGVRTQSFEELRAALSAGKDKVVVEYIDSTSGEAEKRTVGVDGTKIGVSVSETAVVK